jgi:hypothetical protein
LGLLLHLQTGTDMIKRTKTLLITLLVFSIGFLFSCRDREFTFARWELLNNSNHSINVISYLNFDTLKIISLPTKGTIWGTEDYTVTLGKGLPPIAEALGGGDSIVVVFDDVRFSDYTRDDSSDPYSIAYHGNYPRIVESDMLYIRRYTFTNEDYENATPIGQ